MKQPISSLLIVLYCLLIQQNNAYTQNYAMGNSGRYNNNNAGLTSNTSNILSGMNGGYAGTSQASIDHSILNGNHEMLRNDIDFEDYLLRKRTAFVQQMEQNDQAEEKLRAYAEQRLKTLTKISNGKPLSASQQAEAHDLMDWLKKDAEQRANNLAYIKRQDQAVASLEQDQLISFKNQRNALHNMFEDNMAIQSQYQWNKQLQTAGLHQTQSNNGAVSWGRPPEDGLSNGFGYGLGSGGGARRWGY